MLIATSEGPSRRYEVIAQNDGFLVQCRDIETGTVEESVFTLFRTAPAALAFADMAAAAERYAAAGIDDDSRSELETSLREEFARFSSLRMTLRDDGIAADILARHLTQSRMQQGRVRRLH